MILGHIHNYVRESRVSFYLVTHEISIVSTNKGFGKEKKTGSISIRIDDFADSINVSDIYDVTVNEDGLDTAIVIGDEYIISYRDNNLVVEKFTPVGPSVVKCIEATSVDFLDFVNIFKDVVGIA